MTVLTFRCANPVQHTPRPLTPVKHHIVPKSWGGTDDPSNIVRICGTCHDNVHDLLNWYVRVQGIPSWEVRQHYSVAVRAWATTAWGSRPSDKPPWTTAQG